MENYAPVVSLKVARVPLHSALTENMTVRQDNKKMHSSTEFLKKTYGLVLLEVSLIGL